MDLDTDELIMVIEDHLDKLADEREKFRELTKNLDLEKGPHKWQKIENIANRIHNFYMGIEQIFKRIAKEYDNKDEPDGPRWHQKLLSQMSMEGEKRPPIVDEDLKEKLIDFLSFRHFYREGYRIDVEWEEMKEVVKKYEGVYKCTTDSIKKFLKDIR